MSDSKIWAHLIGITLILLLMVGCGNNEVAIPPTMTKVPLPPTAASTETPSPSIPTPAPTEIPATPTKSVDELRNELDAMLQNVTDAGIFSGAVLIAQNDQIILRKGYSYANKEEELSNTPQTKFRIASLSKQLTAMAIMILQEQGQLNVEDSICDYLTECPDAWQPITIHHLLTHTSGIPENLGSYTLQDPALSSTLEDSITELKTMPLDFAPGEDFVYTNMGYILLGKVIEAASDASYETFLRENIFDPLQMANSGFEPNREDVAIGYKNQTVAARQINLWILFSSSGLYSTVDDLYAWDQALYSNELVSQQSLDQIFTAHVKPPEWEGWGYGYGWYVSPDDLPSIVSHRGAIAGYHSGIQRNMDENVTIIILTNQENVDLGVIGDFITKRVSDEN
jgi:CubicO group peptidase (beta-lactamase class C family)